MAFPQHNPLKKKKNYLIICYYLMENAKIDKKETIEGYSFVMKCQTVKCTFQNGMFFLNRS